MKKTEAYVEELKRLGFTTAATRSNKFLAFQHPELNNRVFVGRKMGNVWYGKQVTKSMSILQPDLLLNKLQQKFIKEVVK